MVFARELVNVLAASCTFPFNKISLRIKFNKLAIILLRSLNFSVFCRSVLISFSILSAIQLILVANIASSSFPLILTRTPKSPSPIFSTAAVIFAIGLKLKWAIVIIIKPTITNVVIVPTIKILLISYSVFSASAVGSSIKIYQPKSGNFSI